MVIGTYILITTLNINGLNAPTKDINWLNGSKNKPVYMLSTRDPLQTERGWKKIFHANGSQIKQKLTHHCKAIILQ